MHADPMVAEYGVGIYDSQWSKINAIWYMKSKNVSKAENVWGDFDVCINNRSELYYPNIQNTSGKTKLYFELASVNDEVSYIEIFDGEKQIGSCEIMKTSGYHHCGYEVFRCDVEVPDKENINLTLKFKGNGGELMRLHWFRFV